MMRWPTDKNAVAARTAIDEMRDDLVGKLETIGEEFSDSGDLPGKRIEWQRNRGRNGGGYRTQWINDEVFCRATVNVSAVQYEREDRRRLESATALSAIVHPRNPHAPSAHFHFSYTKMKSADGYWRMMADLNPAIANDTDTAAFREAVGAAAVDVADGAWSQGDRYFHIPALDRHRGAAHFYLESFRGTTFDDDKELAQRIASAAFEAYAAIVSHRCSTHRVTSERDRRRQLEYHTVYAFQVLTLDRGTTSGLLAHDDNDAGILGSIPCRIDPSLLFSWVDRLPSPQDELLQTIVTILGGATPALVDDDKRLKLAAALRTHYRKYPEAVSLQARGNTLPPTMSARLTT